MSATPQLRPAQMPSAAIVRLGDLVSYQDGTVVSRTLLKHPSGTVTVFAFDAGQSLSEHTAAFDALVQMLDGKAEITIVDTSYHVEAGQAILLPANQPHALAALTPFKMLLTMIRS
ncbi:MAG TPA: cupin domain-containing protein [Verrucomicrobiae bacterium]|nr:cupin domain-containing protein [Verrucomicrobiae bacterium]